MLGLRSRLLILQRPRPQHGAATILIGAGEYHETVNVTRSDPVTLLVRCRSTNVTYNLRTNDRANSTPRMRSTQQGMRPHAILSTFGTTNLCRPGWTTPSQPSYSSRRLSTPLSSAPGRLVRRYSRSSGTSTSRRTTSTSRTERSVLMVYRAT